MVDTQCDALTEPSFLDLFRRQGKNRKYFHHNFDDDVYHHRSGLNRHIYLKTLDETAQAFKEFEKNVVT
jgi:hypothetical protein